MDEATFVMRTLQDALEPMLPEPSTSALLRVLSTSTNVHNLSEDQDGFYAVVVGTPAGIHRTRYRSIYFVMFQTQGRHPGMAQ